MRTEEGGIPEMYTYNLRFLKQHSLYHQVVWFVGSKPPDQPDPQHRRRIGQKGGQPHAPVDDVLVFSPLFVFCAATVVYLVVANILDASIPMCTLVSPKMTTFKPQTLMTEMIHQQRFVRQRLFSATIAPLHAAMAHFVAGHALLHPRIAFRAPHGHRQLRVVDDVL